MSKKTDILKYLTDRPGMIVFRDDISTELSIEAPTVSAAVSALRQSNNIPGTITQIAAGAYQYVPSNKNHNAPLFEQIAVTKQDRIVLQDEQGNLYVADPL